MNFQNFKIFGKSGSNLQLTPDPYINLQFISSTGKNADGFLITDPSGFATDAEITNKGYLYTENTTLTYQYVFSDGEPITLRSQDASINYIDVSIFNPQPQSTKAISSLTLDLSTNFLYPSVTYAGAIFLKPVSVGLIETEHLFFLEEPSTNYFIRPYDPVNLTIIFQMIGDETEISFFTVDENTQEIVWTDFLEYALDVYVTNTPLTINVGFRSTEEGVYERKLRVIHQVDGVNFTVMEILVNAESIGEDERFRTLLANFGLPDPNDTPHLFKETDINEALPDWEVLNPKSKLMILEHSNIMPYIGTYKALINAIKWLGYDDIYIREWFKNVKENKKISLIIPFDAKDRTQTILYFSPEERKVLKKLNQLSLNYCITRETGGIDDWGTPLTENCYSYNIQEVFIKLLSLKQWLEKNIIGVNAHIIDITGEGVYFERYSNLIYGLTNTGITANYRESLTPVTIGDNQELINSEASIGLTIAEIYKTRIEDLPYRFGDFIQYLYDASGNTFSPEDASLLDDPSILKVGAPLGYPFLNLTDVTWKLSTEENVSGVIGNQFVTNPLFILENEIRYYNIFDTVSHFFDASTDLHILLERAYLRDASNDIWLDSSMYSIYPDACDNMLYIMESSMGVITNFNGYVSLVPSTNNSLDYNIDPNYFVPMLSLKNYKYTDSSGNTSTFATDKSYYLDIIDGKISMNDEGNNMVFINFNYDTSLNEQKITVNAVYESPRTPLYTVDPSVYYHNGPGDPSSLSADNSIYYINVHHIGDYNVELFGFNGYNVPFYNKTNTPYNVWIKTPTVYTLIDASCLKYQLLCSSTSISLSDVSSLINDNKYPIYDRDVPIEGLTIQLDVSTGKPYVKVPSISYFIDVPKHGSASKFYNLTERCTSINYGSKTLTFDPDYQSFYTGDNVILVKFDRGKYSLVQEASTRATNVTGYVMTVDNLPVGFTNFDSSTDVYLLNDTYRATSNYVNNITNKTVKIDVSNYEFLINQMVGLVVTDNVYGYTWGASYRVLDVSGHTHTLDNNIPKLFIDGSTQYTIQAKHAFSTYVDYTIDVSTADERNNFFDIYLNDTDDTLYYLDNTFTTINILFDHNVVNDQWYSSSDNLVNGNFYFYDRSITVDVSTLVILKAVFDPSTYLINQKNIWTVKDNLTKDVVFKVFNDSVPYIFNKDGYYDVLLESYDIYGNLSSKNYEGLLNVI